MGLSRGYRGFREPAYVLLVTGGPESEDDNTVWECSVHPYLNALQGWGRINLNIMQNLGKYSMIKLGRAPGMTKGQIPFPARSISTF